MRSFGSGFVDFRTTEEETEFLGCVGALVPMEKVRLTAEGIEGLRAPRRRERLNERRIGGGLSVRFSKSPLRTRAIGGGAASSGDKPRMLLFALRDTVVGLAIRMFSGWRKEVEARRGFPQGGLLSREPSREIGDEEEVGSSSSVYSSSEDSSAEPK